MATKPETVDYLKAQLAGVGDFRIKAMFGEYALYLDEKLVALICDDRLFVKKTKFGDATLGEGHDCPPYPGAKPSLLIPEDKVADAEWLCSFVKTSASELAPSNRKQ
ncbi:MAG TPA: TfoX/Sxy family protein [Fimbriimonadaceae bacterium]|nr:TfoX/Sxy family protein [Fimbriimonadaceae bacterium]